MTVRLACAVVMVSSLAAASPPWALTSLMRRAETVALVIIDTRDPHGITLHAKTVYRGTITQDALQIDRATLPNGAYVFVALSQGDKPSGPPTDEVRVGQGGVGQAGYRGWLLFPLGHEHGHAVIDSQWLSMWDGEIRIDRLTSIVAAHPYRERGY